MYAGWPANHGAWQWGDEFLVGFLRGRYKKSSMHNVIEPFELMQARSVDGGETWRIEDPAIPIEDHAIFNVPPEALDLARDIIRVRGVYDHGGDYVDPAGGFYRGLGRGRVWEGPFAFSRVEEYFGATQPCTARTCTICTVAGEQLVFLSRSEQFCWGTDDVLVFAHAGGHFEYRGELPSGGARCVMPGVAEIAGRIVAVCRRRHTDRRVGWIEAFASEDAGSTWRSMGEVGE